MSRWREAAVVVAAWAALNAVLAAVLVAFGGPTGLWRGSMYWSSVGLLAVVAATVLLAGHGPPPSRETMAVSGAPAPALALACLIGGLAWVFGVYLAYLAVPLLAFCAARWRRERKERRGA